MFAPLIFACLVQPSSPISWRDAGSRWTVEVTHSPLARRDAFAGVVNRELQSWLRKDFDTAVADAIEAAGDLAETQSEASIFYQGNLEITLATPSLVSTIYTTGSYFGGAHPNTNYETKTFLPGSAGGARQAELKDFAKPGINVADRFSRLILPELRRKQASGIGPTTRVLKADLLESFTINEKGMTWHFAPYAVASYAEGPFEVKLSWSRLKPILNPRGPLSGIMK